MKGYHDIHVLINLSREALKAITRHPDFKKVQDQYSPDMHIGDGILALDQLQQAIKELKTND